MPAPDAANQPRTLLVALDPVLHLHPKELVEDWNADPARGRQHHARVDHLRSPTFDFAAAGLAAITDISYGIFAAIIYDLIKQALAQRKRPQPPFEISETTLPGGTKVIIVKVLERPVDDNL